MSASGIPPILGGDAKAWSESLRRYLVRVRSQLAARSADSSATEDGTILYDRANGYPVVSKNGEWRQIVLGDGYAFLTRQSNVTAAAINTAYAITYDTPSFADGISLGSPTSRIVFEEGGTYLLAFSAQISSTSSSTVAFRFWPRINGANVDGSTILATLHNNGASTVVSRSAIFNVNANDYLEVMWSVDSTSGYLLNAPATAYAPAAPATALSITRIKA
jgi:hypothetical protein